jgi:hypothetical protein
MHARCFRSKNLLVGFIGGVLPFKYEAEKNRSGMTALAGLPTSLELASVCGLQASIDRHVGVWRGTG